MSKPAVHLAGRRDHTDCGKHVTLVDESRNPGYYIRTTKRAARKTPLATTTEHDAVTCAACMRGHEYQSEKTRRARAALEAARTKTFRLSASVNVRAVDRDDADDQARQLFRSRRVYEAVVIEEVEAAQQAPTENETV